MPDTSASGFCPSCKGPIALGESFCPACGQKVAPERRPSVATKIQARTRDENVRRGRGWILAVAIMTLAWAFLQYFIAKNEVEKQIANAERQTAGIDPAERDEMVKANTGMTWQEAVDHDRGQVTLLFVINLVLAGLYLGLWIWAARNAFSAALLALILFVTVALISALLEPKSLFQGILIKILFIAALIKAVSSAYAERKMREAAV